MLMKEAFELEAGMILAQDILNNYDTVVLTAGTELTDSIIMNLHVMEIDFVFVEEPSDDVEDEYEAVPVADAPVLFYEETVVEEAKPPIEVPQAQVKAPKPKTKAHIQEVSRLEKFEMAVQYYKAMYHDVQAGLNINALEVFEIVKGLVQEFYKYDDIFSVLKKLKSNEDYEYTHSTSMAIISVLLAKWLKLPDQKIYTLAQAAYLADIGKAMIPADVLHKREALTLDEQMMMQSHVALTQDILEKAGVGGEILHIAATHHERLNGSGYPYNMNKETITQLSRVVAVADTYHALLSNRPYRDAYSIFEATEMLWNMSYNELDPKVIERLVKFITSFWVGGQVELSNGMTGEVIMANKYDQFRPLVKVENGFIDLSRDRSCKIVGIVNAM